MFILNPRYHSGTLNAATSVRWAKMTKEQMLVIKPTRRNLANEFLQLIGDRSMKKKEKALGKDKNKVLPFPSILCCMEEAESQTEVGQVL